MDKIENQWKVWRACLKGDFTQTEKGVLHSGYWRYQRRDGSWVPVGIWRNMGDKLIVEVNCDVVPPPDDLWMEACFAYALRNPVSYETYRQVVKEGKPWPDEAPKLVENEDDAELHTLLAEAIKLTDQWLDKGVVNDDEAGHVSAFVDKVIGWAKEAEAKRVAEKRPFDEAAKKIQDKWMPLIGGFKAVLADLKNEVLLPYITAKRKLEAARAAATGQNEPPELPTQIRSGFGKTKSLRTVKVAVVEDYYKAAFALIASNHPDLKAEINRIANQIIRSGGNLDGVTIEEKETII